MSRALLWLVNELGRDQVLHVNELTRFGVHRVNELTRSGFPVSPGLSDPGLIMLRSLFAIALPSGREKWTNG